MSTAASDPAADDLAQLTELAARVNAAQTELAVLAARVNATGAWSGDGYRSFAHWLTVTCGLSPVAAAELLRVGEALSTLPQLHDAAARGRLALDKLRDLTRVATPADEEVWVEVALHASGPQLSRICRGYLRAGRDDTESRRSRRGLSVRWLDDGMLELRALLTAEDGAVVLSAIDAVVARDARERAGAAHDGGELDRDPAAAARADALVSLCEDAVREVPAPASAPAGRAAHRVFVHVDAGALVRGDTGGLCHVENGTGLPAGTLRRLGCDAEVAAIIERDGRPLGVGRARRVVSGRLRHALQVRDRTCRFPGCGVPAARTHAHHLVHWADGGRTDLDNLVSLCGFHHRRLHDGVFRIEAAADAPHFIGSSGRRIGTDASARNGSSTTVMPPLAPVLDESGNPVMLEAPDGSGERLDLGYIVSVLCESCSDRQAEARQLVAQAGPDQLAPPGT